MNKLIKYKDEYLTFYNYKEPLKEIKKGDGFGYYGVLLGTVDKKKVQCHVCGELFKSVQAHVFQKHKLNSKQYKDKFELARETALISEDERQRRKELTLKWLASMSDEEKQEWQRKAQEKYREWIKKKREIRTQPRITLETKNKRGTCPDQLLQKIRDVHEVLGKTPTKRDFIDHYESQRYMHIIYATFGSWTKAVKMAGLKPVVQERKGGGRYSDEELLEYLDIFYRENGKPPTETDCRRGLVPDSNIYRRRFGSFTRARELAGITEPVGRWVNHG